MKLKLDKYNKIYLKFKNEDVFINCEKPEEAKISKKLDFEIGNIVTNHDGPIVTYIKFEQGKKIIDFHKDKYNISGIILMDKDFNNLDPLIEKFEIIKSKNRNKNIVITDALGKKNFISIGKSLMSVYVNDLYDIDNFDKYHFIYKDVGTIKGKLSVKGNEVRLTDVLVITRIHKPENFEVELDHRIYEVTNFMDNIGDVVFYITDEFIYRHVDNVTVYINFNKLPDLSLLKLLGNREFFNRILKERNIESKDFFCNEDIIRLMYDI